MFHVKPEVRQVNKGKRHHPKRGNQPSLKKVAPELEQQIIKIGDRLVVSFVRDENSFPIRSTKNERDGWSLHPRKGWRRISTARSRNHIGHNKIMNFVGRAITGRRAAT